MTGTSTAQDVPTRFDVVMDGNGFIFLDAVQSSLPFRTHRATYSLSPTFIDRSNVSGGFGDNQQDWWLTGSQNDWSLGEEQKFFRQADATSRSRYWRGMNMDLAIPGQVTIARNNASLTLPSACTSIIYDFTLQKYYAAGSIDMFEINANGDTVTAKGPHGAGGPITAMTSDGLNVLMSGIGCSLIRSFSSTGGTFSTFSTSTAVSLAFLNNTIYGHNLTNGAFSKWDTSGVPSILFQWKTAFGVAYGYSHYVIAYGGRIIIIRDTGGRDGAELWIYDGNGTSKLQNFEPNYSVHSWCVSEGILFLIGFAKKRGFSRTELRYYANGTVGVAYTSQWTTSVPAGKTSIAPFGNGVMFTEPVYNAMMYYDLAQGGASTFAPFTATSADTFLATSNAGAVTVNGTGTGRRYLASEAASAASLQTSLFDFDSSLSKLVRAVKFDFEVGTDGNGGSVDAFYTTNDVLTAFSSIATSITAGQEYPLNVACRGISILVCLNKGTSTDGPVLKRIYIRAAPLLQQFKRREYVLDCSGDAGPEARELRDGTTMPKTGREQVDDLILLAQSSVAFSTTDRFGTFTSLVDLDDAEGFQIYEMHQDDDTPGKSGTFVVRVKLKEV